MGITGCPPKAPQAVLDGRVRACAHLPHPNFRRGNIYLLITFGRFTKGALSACQTGPFPLTTEIRCPSTGIRPEGRIGSHGNGRRASLCHDAARKRRMGEPRKQRQRAGRSHEVRQYADTSSDLQPWHHYPICLLAEWHHGGAAKGKCVPVSRLLTAGTAGGGRQGE